MGKVILGLAGIAVFGLSGCNGGGASSTASGLTNSTASGQSTVATPAALTAGGIKLWLKADALTGLSDGQAVSTWADSAGNGIVCTGSGATYVADGAGHYASVAFTNDHPFDCGNQFDSFTTGNAAQYTVVYVAKGSGGSLLYKTSGSNYSIGMDNGSGFPYANLNMNAGAGSISDTGNDINTGTMAVETAAIDLTQALPGKFTLYQNGALESVSNSSSGTVTTGPAAAATSAQIGKHFVGTLSEIVIFNRVLNSTDRKAIECYMAAKYAVSVSGC